MEVHWTGSRQCPRKCEDNGMGASERPAGSVNILTREVKHTSDHLSRTTPSDTFVLCVLAHPGARAFITHAGSHGLFEGLCHAVPMVMVPISGDQPDNAQKMASKGVGVVLDIVSVTTESLLQALRDVLSDTR